MIWKVRMVLAALAVGMVMGSARDAQAAIYSPQLVGVSPEGSFYRWLYNVFLTTSGGQFELEQGNGTLSPGTLGSQDFLTLYDIAGYVPGSVFAPGSHAALTPTVLFGITAPLTLPVDSPSLVNLTIRYNTSNQTTNAIFTGFSFLSTSNVGSPLGFYTSQYTITNTGDKGAEIGRVTLPTAAETPVPEPGTLGLLSLALAGLALSRRRQVA
ncbi:PEP-CTERM sorting domain-containing protein [Falsiroseomonas oryzae]|uniref:PEP-CTERM sorting domain-containing protein n=1 Tax=Falsiroseomonas oryzae TaxID=2766473 RepID=UPI0022EA6684|nr:PEP-CTERM sorting domain-containing protein [Roseomonas sp. MO-31]